MLRTKELEMLKIENRIALLTGRNKENGRIVRKLQRRLRKLAFETV